MLYQHGKTGSRVFFTIDIHMVEAMQMQNIKYDVNKLPMTMYLVHLDDELDNIIFLLKGATMLRKFKDDDGNERQITYKQVLKYIAKFNEETDRRLRVAFPENVWMRRTPSLGMLRSKDLYPYCEHPELSCAYFGAPYHSLRIPDHVETISNERVRDFLNLMILSYELTFEALSKTIQIGKGLKETLGKMLDYQKKHTSDLYPMWRIEE